MWQAARLMLLTAWFLTSRRSVRFLNSKIFCMLRSEEKCVAFRAPVRAQIQNPANDSNPNSRALHTVHVRTLANGTVPLFGDFLKHHNIHPASLVPTSPNNSHEHKHQCERCRANTILDDRGLRRQRSHPHNPSTNRHI